MGVTGLYAYLNNRHPEAATTIRLNSSQLPQGSDVKSKRCFLMDGNGLYHHLQYKYCYTAPRSLGGEWARFAEAARRFFRIFQRMRIDVRVMFDGCTSAFEAKSTTRLERQQQRMEKMSEFKLKMEEAEQASALPSGCVEVDPAAEAQLPVPSNSLMAFVQILQSLGIPAWNADGENDEHLAALALQLHRDSGGELQVDILGQDSDFLIFEMATQPTDDDNSISPSSSSNRQGGYVPFDSLRFDMNDNSEEDATLSFRRYTSAAILTALQLPACLLPSLACLIGNDSNLELDHFHAYLRSPPFSKLMSSSKIVYAPTKSSSKNTNPLSVEVNGGFQTGSQLVEAALAYMQYLHKAFIHTRTDQLQLNDAAHQEAMNRTVVALLGPEADLPRSHSTGLHASPSDTCHRTPLELFRDAQLKYSLARFFQPQLVSSTDCDWVQSQRLGMFDPGFQIESRSTPVETSYAIEEKDMTDSDESIPEDNVPISNSTTTAFLLPLELIHHYKSAQLSPIVLSILLMRQYHSHVALGDIMHPCVIHRQSNGSCVRSAAEAALKYSTCVTADQCSSGIRQRFYQLLLLDMKLQPRSLPSLTPSEQKPLSMVSNVFSKFSSSIKSLLGARDTTSTTTSSTSPTSAAPLSSSLQSSSQVIVRECIFLAPSSSSMDDSDEGESYQIQQQWRDVPLIAIEDTHKDDLTSLSNLISSWPPLFPATINGAASSLSSSTSGIDWLSFFSVLDVSPDLGAFVSKKLPSRSIRLQAFISAMTPLMHQFSSAAPLVMVFRTVFLQALRPLLATRFEPPTIGAKIEATIQAQLDHVMIGINALVLQFALTYCGCADLSTLLGSTNNSVTCSAVMCFHALPLGQLFADTYQWCVYTLQLLQLRASMCSQTSKGDVAQTSLPILPLFQTYSGELFHRIYLHLLTALDSHRSSTQATKGGSQHRKTVNKPPPARPSSSSSTSTTAAAALSSPLMPSIATPFLFSPALSNVLSEVDGVVDPISLRLVSSSTSSNALTIFAAIKSALFQSVGLTYSWTDSGAILTSISVDSSITLSSGAPIPRPLLPYETCVTVDSTGGNSLRPVIQTNFHLCCAAPISDDGNTSLTGLDKCGCGFKPFYYSTTPSPSASPDSTSSDQPTSSSSSWQKVKKKKVKKSKR